MKQFNRILKTSGIIKAAPNDPISSTLSKLKSSHDGAFVFDDEKFMGVVNPYYCLIKSYNPGKTKVEHCLFHPPRVTPTDPLERIARLMSESKIHYLPVFDESNAFVGITSARRILALIKDLDIMRQPLSEVLKGKNGEVISVTQNATIGDAMNLFKEHKISKLVMVDANNKLKGILSYYDLIPYLIAPGISKSEGRGRETNRDKQKLMGMKVGDYAKTTIVALGPQNTMKEVIDDILKKNRGSVIVVNDLSEPIGILTTKDIFSLLEPQEVQKEIQIITKNVSIPHKNVVEEIAAYVQDQIAHDPSILRAKVLLEEEKGGNLFNIHISVIPVKGKPRVIKREGPDLKTLLIEVKMVFKTVENGK